MGSNVDINIKHSSAIKDKAEERLAKKRKLHSCDKLIDAQY
jgi:hypothetical protein